jgi:hypothetical protein
MPAYIAQYGSCNPQSDREGKTLGGRCFDARQLLISAEQIRSTWKAREMDNQAQSRSSIL